MDATDNSQGSQRRRIKEVIFFILEVKQWKIISKKGGIEMKDYKVISFAQAYDSYIKMVKSLHLNSLKISFGEYCGNLSLDNWIIYRGDTNV